MRPGSTAGKQQHHQVLQGLQGSTVKPASYFSSTLPGEVRARFPAWQRQPGSQLALKSVGTVIEKSQS